MLKLKKARKSPKRRLKMTKAERWARLVRAIRATALMHIALLKS